MDERGVEILCVGTELLLGSILNGNARWIAEQLAGLGLPHYRQTVVGDNVERLTAAAREAAERSSVLITTGGLGPTPDDLTTATLASAFGAPADLDEDGIVDGLDLSILLGAWGRLAGAGFVAFNLGGAVIHYRLAAQAGSATLSAGASEADRESLAGVAGLGTVGNVTSAEKNFVLAAVGLFFFLVGRPRLLSVIATTH